MTDIEYLKELMFEKFSASKELTDTKFASLAQALVLATKATDTSVANLEEKVGTLRDALKESNGKNKAFAISWNVVVVVIGIVISILSIIYAVLHK